MGRGRIIEALYEGVLVCDGAKGTNLSGWLDAGEPPDILNIRAPERVFALHRSFVDAGSDIIVTNTFSSSRIKLSEFGIEAKIKELNREGVRIARKAASGRAFVCASIGPGGRFLEPLGELSFRDASANFREQAELLSEESPDAIILETFFDIRELKAAILAVKGTASIPIFASMTFLEEMRSPLGTPPAVFALVAEKLGVSSIGTNCGEGYGNSIPLMEEIASFSSLPLFFHPNAGRPELREGRTCYDAGPMEFSGIAAPLIELGVRSLGGCCGTTPSHIRELREVVDTLRGRRKRFHKAPSEGMRGTAVASRTEFVVFGPGKDPVPVGERINPTGRKGFREEIVSGDTRRIRAEAIAQAGGGARILDVNLGGGEWERGMMERAVFSVNIVTKLPLSIDSPEPESLEEGLTAVDGRPILNSVPFVREKTDAVFPLAKGFGVPVVCLTMDGKGIPESAADRVKIARRFIEVARRWGVEKDDLVIDCIALPLSLPGSNLGETLKAVRIVNEELKCSTILGISNISFGLPRRERINAVFLSQAIGSGLSAAIIDPMSSALMETIKVATAFRRPGKGGIEILSPSIKGKGEEGERPWLDTHRIPDRYSGIYFSIFDGDCEKIPPLLERFLDEGDDPLGILNSVIIPGMEILGLQFREKRIMLPHLLLSAKAAEEGVKILRRKMKRGEGEGWRVVLATVEGDIHDIGKNIVAAVFEANGIEVHDLGKSVTAADIVKKTKELKAHAVGLSALMTTTMPEMGKVVRLLKGEGLRAITIIGGACVDQDFANSIGADLYGKDAVEGVKRLRAALKEMWGESSHPLRNHTPSSSSK